MTTITLDPSLEKHIRTRAKKLGKTLEEVVHIQLQYFVEEDETASPSVIRELRQVEEDVKHGRKISPSFSDARALIQHLHSV